MSLLDHPDARAILADAILTAEAVRGCQDRLTRFLGRYLPRFRRAEQRANATLVIRGLLSGLQRKTCEPIAVEAGVHRKPIQFLVGAGRWDDEAVMAEVRRHVAEELGDERAVLVIDATTFPKSGADSCGVGRQWCGRLGQAGELPAGDLPGLRRPRRVRPAGPTALPAEGLGRRRGPSGQVPRPRGGRVPGGMADRRRADRAERAGTAARLGRRRRRVRTPGPVPGLAPGPRRAVRPRRAERHGRPRPGVPPPRAAAPATAAPGRSRSGASTPGRPPSRRAAGPG